MKCYLDPHRGYRFPMEVQRTFPSEVRSAHRAQHFVAELLGGAAVDTTAARIVTSELVANAVLHSRTAVKVTLSVNAPRGPLIEVADGRSDGDLSPQAPPPDATSGRGLMFVDQLAEAWGVERSRRGKTVWARLRRPPLAS